MTSYFRTGPVIFFDRDGRQCRTPDRVKSFLFLLQEPRAPFCVFLSTEKIMEAIMGRGILLWLLGVPIPVILLLWLFFGR